MSIADLLAVAAEIPIAEIPDARGICAKADAILLQRLVEETATKASIIGRGPIVNLKVKAFAELVGCDDPKRVYEWAKRKDDPLPTVHMGKASIRIPKAAGYEWAVRNKVMRG